MELEFDKEIDALLRKAGPPRAKPSGAHLDADMISAFTEGAVPAVARKAYTAHLADCDSCRKALSQIALLNEAAPTDVMAAVAAQAPAAVRADIPWYRSLFRTPGLAIAMGLLVVAFGGVLVYLVTQRTRVADNTVAFDPNGTGDRPAIPYAGVEANTNSAASDSASIATSNAAAATSNSQALANAPATAGNLAARPAAPPTGADEKSADSAVSGGSAAAQPPPVTTAVPPSSAANVADKPKDEAKTERDDRSGEKETTRSSTLSQDRVGTVADLAAKRAAPGGPRRAQEQVQNQVQTDGADASSIRKVGGRTFRYSDGAWYDSAYHGQTTMNVSRSSAEFNKLDSGLRSIANQLAGVVVVVRKGKAYRID